MKEKKKKKKCLSAVSWSGEFILFYIVELVAILISMYFGSIQLF